MWLFSSLKKVIYTFQMTFFDPERNTKHIFAKASHYQFLHRGEEFLKNGTIIVRIFPFLAISSLQGWNIMTFLSNG